MSQEANEEVFIEPVLNDQGKPIYVPIMEKDRDTFIFHLGTLNDSYAGVLDSTQLNSLGGIDSFKFYDTLMDDTCMGDLTDDEVRTKLYSAFSMRDEEHPEMDASLYEGYFLTIDCPGCGMSYSFRELSEIPHDKYSCSCCDRPLIVYTGKEESNIKFKGDSERTKRLILEVSQKIYADNNSDENYGEDEDEDSETY